MFLIFIFSLKKSYPLINIISILNFFFNYMEKALYSALEFQNIDGIEQSSFTEYFNSVLQNSINPKIFIVIGKTREGKSTLFNHILSDKTLNTPNLRLSNPFNAQGGEEAITKEFVFYGPIKGSEISRRNNIKYIGDECDCFFIDTEGSGNLYQMSKFLYHGIFSLESIATSILFVSKGTIEQEALLYISRHIQTSKLFNSNVNNNFPGLAIISRDVGLKDYDIPFEQLDIERINQDNYKLNDLKKRLNERTQIIFDEDNLKYIAEPPLDMPFLFLNSIKDLWKFLIKNAQNQSSKTPNQIINKFISHEKIIKKYPVLLDTNVPMEETFNNVFSIELQEASNKINNENSNLIINEINNFSLLELSNFNPLIYENRVLNELENKFQNETNLRYDGMKEIIPTQYNLILLYLKENFKLLIQNKINETMKHFENQMKSFIETAQINSEIIIKQKISDEIKKLSSQQLREINIDSYVNKNTQEEIEIFEKEGNKLFENLKNISQTKDFYKAKSESLENLIKLYRKEELLKKFESHPPWPKNINELLKEQNIKNLIPQNKYTLYLNKRPYIVVARNDGKISLPNIKALEFYRYEELPCWRNSGGKVYESWNNNIDTWFEPETQVLLLSTCNVYQNNWSEGGHKSLFVTRPPRPQQKKTTLNINVDNPWKIKEFNKSGSVSVSLSNYNHNMYVSGSGGSVQNIKLEFS